jgi:peptide/nickel transport system ATP-binding protein
VGDNALSGDSSASVVCARDLSVHYRSNGLPPEVLAVSGVSLDISKGEIIGIVGESGSGKSSLGMAIAGLARPTHPGSGLPEISGGTLNVLGSSMRHIGRRGRDSVTLRVGYLAQDGAERLRSEFTIAENVAEPIFRRDRRFNTREATAAVAYVIDALRLPLTVMNRMPWELSSGQRQRAALAKALILEPVLLVADEPTRGVDVGVREGVLESLKDLQADRDFSAIMISSELAVATAISSRLAVMQNGILVGLGTTESVLSDPSHPYVKGLARARALLKP